MASTTAKREANRRRSSSVTNALNQVPLNHQKGAPLHPTTPSPEPTSQTKRPNLNRQTSLPDLYHSLGFWNDLRTGRWMLVPSRALTLYMIPVVLYLNHALLCHFEILRPGTPNPFAPFILPSGRLANGNYVKTWWDFAFLGTYVVFWSFVRQAVTLNILRPMGKALGIKGAKIMRFTEQGYAVFYFTITGTLGLYVMHYLPTWWYKTEYFWIDYPHREMSFALKFYYLAQGAYWLQQMIILVARVEKPRKDFTELVIHHIVTLWLIGWSYNHHLTRIGVSIYVTMDVSDIFLAVELAKCVNYVDEKASVPVFAFFVCVWTYFRHYLNLVILWSVWYQWDLIPDGEKVFDPVGDKWMPHWMQWQIFIPILLLQFVNLFWYFLILRILVRALFTDVAQDERSDDEDEEPSTEKKVNKLKKGKAE